MEQETTDKNIFKRKTTETLKTEPSEPPEIDYDQVEEFNQSLPITALITDLKIEDSSGTQKPTRDCLKPQYGVSYFEDADFIRKVGAISLGGASFYAQPTLGSRMRKVDLHKRQILEKSARFGLSLNETEYLENNVNSVDTDMVTPTGINALR